MYVNYVSCEKRTQEMLSRRCMLGTDSCGGLLRPGKLLSRSKTGKEHSEKKLRRKARAICCKPINGREVIEIQVRCHAGIHGVHLDSTLLGVYTDELTTRQELDGLINAEIESIDRRMDGRERFWQNEGWIRTCKKLLLLFHGILLCTLYRRSWDIEVEGFQANYFVT